MQASNSKHSEALNLANQVAGRYGRLALTRAAGEAAAAQRNGDPERSALWSSVVAYLRETVIREAEAAVA